MGNGPITALVVDDEEALREIIGEVLSFMKIEAITAEGGHAALEIAREKKEDIDLLLIDLFMPQMSGKETYEKLNELIPGRPVLFMSGYDQDPAITEIKKNTNHRFLKKPFTISDLREVVNSLLGLP